jgi:hypothetical protein
LAPQLSDTFEGITGLKFEGIGYWHMAKL